MSLPTERWLNLLDPKLEEERSEITEDLLEAEGREFVAEVRSKLDHALAVLAVEAQQEADMYWNAHKSAREEASEDEQGRVGTGSHSRRITRCRVVSQQICRTSSRTKEKGSIDTYQEGSRSCLQHVALQERACLGTRVDPAS